MKASRALSVLLATMLMVATLPAVAGGSVRTLSGPVGEEFQITTNEFSQNQIEFWGDTVVYADHRAPGSPAVYGFDLGANSEFPVSTELGSQNNPSVWGDTVVHMKKRKVWNPNNSSYTGAGDIWGYDRITGRNFVIDAADAHQCNPFIWGDWVAWVDARNTPDPVGGDYNRSDVFAYNMATEELQTFDTSPTVSGLHAPAIYEDMLLVKETEPWTPSGYPGRLWLFDLSGSEEPTVVPGSENQYYWNIDSPNIWGNWVVWQDGGNGEVLACDLTSMETTVVATTGAGGGVDVWTDLVVWSDDRNDDGDIYMMDLTTGVETTICADPARQGRCRIDNGTVVWVDERNGDHNADVYGMYLFSHISGFAGATRYDTAVEASRRAFGSGADTAVIATGENWPDALAASGLAGAANGPVLLVRPNSVPAAVVAELNRLGAKDAYIIGGTSAITASVESYLKGILPGSVTRLGGATRYDTASMVSAEAVDLMGTGFGGTAILASGINPPDAVASSALAAGLGMPLYLTKTTSLPTGLVGSMTAAGVDDVYIVGGAAAVSVGVETAVDAAFDQVERLSGSNRYATAVAIAEEGVDLGLTWDGVGFATGTNFPDALAGGVVQGLNGSVLLLTRPDTLDASVSGALTTNKDAIGLVRFYGGPAAISDTVRTAIQNILDS